MHFPHGLVIGKFLPPHRGHQRLIDSAEKNCRSVTLIVCAKPADSIPGELRQIWLQELYPTSNVLLIDDRYDPNDSKIWANNVRRWLGQAPDAVFTSEAYGDLFAECLGCTHVLVDQLRSVVPCSGTMIRTDPYAAWDYLPPQVRGWYAKRICIVGAESTGTSTLASALSDHYASTMVPEYGREYWERKLASGNAEWHTSEFVHIAQEQERREEAAARDANRVLICDTNSLATFLWHRRYLGFDSAEVWSVGANARCDLYVLTGDEIPFVQDGTRDGEHIRHEMHRWFRELLEQQTLPWIEVRGPRHERLNIADASIRQLFATSQWTLPAI